MTSADSAIDYALSRSWLLVSGDRPEAFGDAVASEADQLIFDLEDAVADARKPLAREAVAAWLEQPGNNGWVRINDADTDFWSDDIARLRVCPGLRGVVLAKVESAAHVRDTVVALGGAVDVIALVESALGIEEATAIARAGAARLAFGSGDYRRDTGMAATDLAMSYPRARLANSSRIGRLPNPIDGPTPGPDLALLRAQTVIARDHGMTGRLCLYPAQARVVNEAMSPTAADVDWARDFLGEFERAGGQVRDGSDKPRLFEANRITHLASAYGVTTAGV
ncbi:HpcH/HpaI aldolase/citrate lyase family protein [Gordonia hydrophobica]|uniref:Aldolase/citrate lyase family protein n=1 Tax=Gordonia hydrophobica TaxID=40516 RepID=A0ABZ2U405_9ACTN|nr:aldolase/citrate lyase family protein [Gordonia hydrophobica]MBM7368029.1 citrate lyase subunit beta/citryl-CoA lyase [Gordonia hydrophobica]